MRSIQCSLLALAGGLLTIGGCSREAQQPPQQPDTTTDFSAISAESWVDDVKLASTNAGSAAQDDNFIVGEPLELSMRIDHAPPGTQVTTYWYGPDNLPLAYETKPTAANGSRLSFTQDNTHFWEAGTYRAEIWIGDEKVEEESFDIVAG